jgi:hypothetical protein
MIWRLIKREPALWYWPLYVCVQLPFLLLLGAPAAVFTLPAAMVFFAGEPWRRATPFEAALPIAARQFFLARLLVIMALLWPQAFVSSATLALWRSSAHAALAPILAAGVCTLGVAGLQSGRLGVIASLQRPGVVFFGAWLLVAFSGLPIRPGTVEAILSVCLLASVALFFRIWFLLPKSFELAPRVGYEAGLGPGGVVLRDPDLPVGPDAGVPKGRETRRASAGAGTLAAWMPFLRSVFPPPYVRVLPFLVPMGAIPEMLPMCGFWLPMGWLLPIRCAGWMRTLPVKRRLTLWATVGPAVLCLIGSYAAGALLRRSSVPLRVHAVAVAVIMALALLSGLFCCASDWRRLRHLPARIRGWWPMVPMGLSLAAIAVASITGYLNRFPDLLQALANALPASRLQAATALAVPVIALYLALDRVFLESDHTGKLGV